ncbi:MAG: flagellin FliC [Deltaproteobacteria bacterium]|nr:flagellin FliC [Deltaproteobacteria bacterium]
MALRINHNVMALNSYRHLSITQGKLSKSIEKLSSGLRIVRAADDAAGLAISEKMRADIRGFNQAVRNANDGVSMLQTAEGALNEISGMLTRMRELAEQAATGTVGTSQKGTLDQEFQALVSEINRIADATEFNGTKLINGALSSGSATAATFQIGIGNNSSTDRLSIGISGMHAASIGLSGISISATANALTALAAVDTAIANVASQRGDIGAVQNRLESTIANLNISAENLTAAESQIRDVDMALEMANFTKNQIMTQAGTAMLAQANLANQSVLTLLG